MIKLLFKDMMFPIFCLFNTKIEVFFLFFGSFSHFLLDLFIAVLGLALQGFIALYYLNSISVFKHELNFNINDYVKPRKTYNWPGYIVFFFYIYFFFE